MTERIRVLRIIARMNVGGPALQVSGLVRGLDGNRFESRLIAGQVEEGEADFVDLRGTETSIVRNGALGRSVAPLRDLRSYARIADEIQRFRPHVVHTHTAKAGVLGRIASMRSGVPVLVHTFHGHLLHGYFSPSVTRAVRQVERVLARRTTALCAVGARVRDELLAEGIGVPDQYTVMPPGVSLPAPPSRADARESLGLPADVPVIAFVARLTKVKRPDRLIETAREVMRRTPDAIFLVAGGGPLADEVRRDATSLSSSVRLLGWVPDVERVYAASDLVVLTSDNEGMPVSLIEAAMAGVPAVATDVGSVAEVIEDGMTGLLTAPDATQLAPAIETLLRDEPLRRRMGAKARRRAHERFGVERLVADTEELYERLLAEKTLVRGAGRKPRP